MTSIERENGRFSTSERMDGHKKVSLVVQADVGARVQTNVEPVRRELVLVELYLAEFDENFSILCVLYDDLFVWHILRCPKSHGRVDLVAVVQRQDELARNATLVEQLIGH